MRFAKSMLFGISALGLAVGSAFANDASPDMSSPQAAAEEIWIAQPAIIVSESAPVVLDSSGSVVRDGSGNAVSSSGTSLTHEEAVVLYELEPSLPPSSLSSQSSLEPELSSQSSLESPEPAPQSSLESNDSWSGSSMASLPEELSDPSD